MIPKATSIYTHSSADSFIQCQLTGVDVVGSPGAYKDMEGRAGALSRLINNMKSSEHSKAHATTRRDKNV